MSEALHELRRFTRFQLGMTPTRPSRPLYGYHLECSCGWKYQCNETKREATREWKRHVREAIAAEPKP